MFNTLFNTMHITANDKTMSTNSSASGSYKSQLLIPIKDLVFKISINLFLVFFYFWYATES